MATKFKNFFKSFTLIELIIVIAIIAVLGASAFLLLTQWMSKGRDAQKISDLNVIQNALSIQITKEDGLPLPDGYNVVKTGTNIIIYQGKFGSGVISKMNTLTKVPMDRQYGEYEYSLLGDRITYKVQAIIENEQNKSAYMNRVFADELYYRYIGSDAKGIIVGDDFVYLPNMFLTGYVYGEQELGDAMNNFLGSKVGEYVSGGIVNKDNEGGIIAMMTGLGLTNAEATSIFSKATGVSVSTTGTPIAASNCEFNGEQVIHNSSVTAYEATTVSYGNTCTSEQRTCIDGILNGTYTNANCVVDGATGTFNLSQTTVTQGTTVTISNNCSTQPTGYSSSNEAVGTIAGNTITTLTAGTTNITPVGGACGDNTQKTLTVTAPPITQWKDIPGTNCTNDDIIIGGKTWAGCNSVLGTTGITTNNNVYNGACYNYLSWKTTTTTNCNETYLTYTAKENAFNSTYGEDNIWGKLYTWNNLSTECKNPIGGNFSNTTASTSNCACPTGWHVPTEQDFLDMEIALGCTDSSVDLNDKCNGLGWFGKSTKSASNNIVKALKLPLAGYRQSGTFYNLTLNGFLWSSTEYDSTNARYRVFNYSSALVGSAKWSKSAFGYSVRCVKD